MWRFQSSLQHFQIVFASLFANYTRVSGFDSTIGFHSTSLWIGAAAHNEIWDVWWELRKVLVDCVVACTKLCKSRAFGEWQKGWGQLFELWFCSQCLNPSFFLSIDMQLFWLCPLLLYPAFKYGWKYLWVLPTVVALTEFCTFVISRKYELLAFPMLKWDYKYFMVITLHLHRRLFSSSPEALSIYLRKIYYPTHIRCGPTLVSLCLGYQLYVWRNQRISINKVGFVELRFPFHNFLLRSTVVKHFAVDCFV